MKKERWFFVINDHSSEPGGLPPTGGLRSNLESPSAMPREAVHGSRAKPLTAGAGPQALPTCQIWSLYSLMVRSEEKKPEVAVFMMAILSHFSRLR